MKIEIVEDGGRRDTDPAGTEAEAAEESSAGDGRKRKSRKILAEVRKALFMAVVAAVVVPEAAETPEGIAETEAFAGRPPTSTRQTRAEPSVGSGTTVPTRASWTEPPVIVTEPPEPSFPFPTSAMAHEPGV